jgi:Mce-associated membrane protein
MSSHEPPSANPTWYDILGVAQDASPDEIKAAWRSATDKFEPGSGTSQFRLFNEAADVLLHPERRAAYDAQLAGEQVAQTIDLVKPEPEVVEPEEGPEPEAGPDAEAEPEAEAGPDAEAEPEAGVEPVPVPVEDDEPAPTESSSGRRSLLDWLGRNLRWVVVAAVPILVVSLVVALVAVLGANVWRIDVQGVRPAVKTFDAGPEATAAAERALKAVLSYDYRHMEADRDRAATYLTPKYRAEYLKNFNDLLTKGPDGSPGPVEKTKAVVTADVLDSGVVDAEGDRVRVVVFVNQSSVKGTAAPTVFQDRVVATMVHDGDAWLVDDIKSY